MAEVGRYCSFKGEAPTRHTMMFLLAHKPNSMTLKDISNFVQKFEAKTTATLVKRRPEGGLLSGGKTRLSNADSSTGHGWQKE